ncbi:MAG: DUF6788 family protein, partial [Bryobacteraceae bacterium]
LAASGVSEANNTRRTDDDDEVRRAKQLDAGGGGNSGTKLASKRDASHGALNITETPCLWGLASIQGTLSWKCYPQIPRTRLFLASQPSVCNTLGSGGFFMPDSVLELEKQRADLLLQISRLGDLRPGSITATQGRCGNPSCHCHPEADL